MKANTKLAEPIDLSTCQIGQKLRLRNGSEATLSSKGGPHLTYPFFTSDGQSHMRNGRVWNKEEVPQDVVEILKPLKKKQNKKPLATTAAPKMSKKEILKAITYFRGILQALEDQIKP